MAGLWYHAPIKKPFWSPGLKVIYCDIQLKYDAYIVKTLFGILLVLILPARVIGQMPVDFDKVRLETEQVAGRIHMIKMVGGHASNVAVLYGEDGVLLVDSMYGEVTGDLVAEVRELTDQPIRFLINTHDHIDHTGGNANLAGMGVEIIAHEHVRDRMADPRARNAPPETSRPSITYKNYLTLYLNGEKINVYHVAPSHTSGDSFIHFENSGVLHMGDVFRTVTYPNIDTRDGGSYRGIIEVINQTITAFGPETKIIPGHGRLSGINDLIEVRDMMTAIRERVKGMKANGMSVNEIITARPTAEFDARWNWPDEHFMDIETFIRYLYAE